MLLLKRYLIYVEWNTGMEKEFEVDGTIKIRRLNDLYHNDELCLFVNDVPLIGLNNADKLVIYDRKYIIEKNSNSNS